MALAMEEALRKIVEILETGMEHCNAKCDECFIPATFKKFSNYKAFDAMIDNDGIGACELFYDPEAEEQ